MALKEKLLDIERNPNSYVNLYLGHFNENRIDNGDKAVEALIYGRALLLIGKHQEAIVPLMRALRYCKNNELVEVEFYASINLGVAYREMDEIYIALDFYESALNLSYELEDFSSVIEALVGMGSAYIEMQNIDKAIAYFEKALLYEAQNIDARVLSQLYNNLAYAFIFENKLEEAMALYVKAKQLVPELNLDESNVNRHILELNVAELYFMMGAYKKSKQIYEIELSILERENIEFLLIDCHMALAKIAEVDGDYQKALKHMKAYQGLKDYLKYVKDDILLESSKSQLSELMMHEPEEMHRSRSLVLENKTLKLEKTLQNLSRVSDIGQKLVASLDIEEIFALFKREVSKNENVDVISLVLVDEKAHTLSYRFFEERGKRLPIIVRPLDDRSSIAGLVYNEGRDLFIKNYDVEYLVYFEKPLYNAHGNMSTHSKTIIACRLMVEDKCMGMVSIQSYLANAFEDEDFEVFKTLAAFLGIAIANAQKRAIIESEAVKLEFLSYHDSLTGLKNRRAFNERIKALYNRQFGLIMGDMNGLKQINDSYGHMFGDAYLKRAAQMLKQLCEPYEVYRLAGDEFAILIGKPQKAHIIDLCEQILYEFSREEIKDMNFSISLGFAIKEAHDFDFENAFAVAESRMYAHKKNAAFSDVCCFMA